MGMTMKAEILVIRRLDNGIYKSSGGGETQVFSRHAAGPRGYINALKSHSEERKWAVIGYGNIGAGAGWLEVVPEGGQPGDGIPLEDWGWSGDGPIYANAIPVGATWEWWSQVK